jgi:hypothetical protein
MSKLKSTLAATFLTLVLAVPALAGNIGTPGSTPPPPPPDPCETIDSTGSSAPGDEGSLELISSELVDVLIAVLSLI